MPSSGLMLSNGGTGGNGGRMDGTLSQSMDSVNTVAPEEEVIQSTNHLLCILGPRSPLPALASVAATLFLRRQ